MNEKLTFGDLRDRFLNGDRTINPGRKSSPYTPPELVADEPNPVGCRGLRTSPIQPSSRHSAPKLSERKRQEILSRSRSAETIARIRQRQDAFVQLSIASQAAEEKAAKRRMTLFSILGLGRS